MPNTFEDEEFKEIVVVQMAQHNATWGQIQEATRWHLCCAFDLMKESRAGQCERPRNTWY